jgi:hypothetical protein
MSPWLEIRAILCSDTQAIFSVHAMTRQQLASALVVVRVVSVGACAS